MIHDQVIKVMINLYQPIARKWSYMRMAAEEFYFKKPYEPNQEYAIMRNIITLSVIPVGLVFLFAYARLVAPVSHLNALICFSSCLMMGYIIAILIIRSLKKIDFVHKLHENYMIMPIATRKKFYSFIEVFKLIFLCTVLPWVMCFVIIFVICILTPKL